MPVASDSVCLAAVEASPPSCTSPDSSFLPRLSIGRDEPDTCLRGNLGASTDRSRTAEEAKKTRTAFSAPARSSASGLDASSAFPPPEERGALDTGASGRGAAKGGSPAMPASRVSAETEKLEVIGEKGNAPLPVSREQLNSQGDARRAGGDWCGERERRNSVQDAARTAGERNEEEKKSGERSEDESGDREGEGEKEESVLTAWETLPVSAGTEGTKGQEETEEARMESDLKARKNKQEDEACKEDGEVGKKVEPSRWEPPQRFSTAHQKGGDGDAREDYTDGPSPIEGDTASTKVDVEREEDREKERSTQQGTAARERDEEQKLSENSGKPSHEREGKENVVLSPVPVSSETSDCAEGMARDSHDAHARQDVSASREEKIGDNDEEGRKATSEPGADGSGRHKAETVPARECCLRTEDDSLDSSGETEKKARSAGDETTGRGEACAEDERETGDAQQQVEEEHGAEGEGAEKEESNMPFKEGVRGENETNATSPEQGLLAADGRVYSVLALLGFRGESTRLCRQRRSTQSFPQQTGCLSGVSRSSPGGGSYPLKELVASPAAEQGSPSSSDPVDGGQNLEAPSMAAPADGPACWAPSSTGFDAGVDSSALHFLTVPRGACRGAFSGQSHHLHPSSYRQGGGSRAFEGRDTFGGGIAPGASGAAPQWHGLPGAGGASHDSRRTNVNAFRGDGSNRGHQTYSPRPHASGPSARSPAYLLPLSANAHEPLHGGLGVDKGGKFGRSEGAKASAAVEDRSRASCDARASLSREERGVGRGAQAQRRSSTCRSRRASPRASGEVAPHDGLQEESLLSGARPRQTERLASSRSSSQSAENVSAAHSSIAAGGDSQRGEALLSSSPGLLSGRKCGSGASSRGAAGAVGASLAEPHGTGDAPAGCAGGAPGARSASLLGAVPGRGPRPGKTRRRSKSFASPPPQEQALGRAASLAPPGLSLVPSLLPLVSQKKQTLGTQINAPLLSPGDSTRSGVAEASARKEFGDGRGSRRGSLGVRAGRCAAEYRGVSAGDGGERRGRDAKDRMHSTGGREGWTRQREEARPLLSDAWQLSTRREEAQATGQQSGTLGIQGEDEATGEGCWKAAAGRTGGPLKEEDEAKSRRGERERRSQGGARGGAAEERQKDGRAGDEGPCKKGKEQREKKGRTRASSTLPAGSSDGSGEELRLEDVSVAGPSRAAGKEATPGEKKKNSAKAGANEGTAARQSANEERRGSTSGGKDGKKEGKKKASSLASAAQASKQVSVASELGKPDSLNVLGSGMSRRGTAKCAATKGEAKPLTRCDEQTGGQAGNHGSNSRSRTENGGCDRRVQGEATAEGDSRRSGSAAAGPNVGCRETAPPLSVSRPALLPGLQYAAAHPRGGRRERGDVWDLPPGKAESGEAAGGGGPFFFTLGDIRQAEREIEGGRMSLKQFVEKSRREEERRRESLGRGGREKAPKGVTEAIATSRIKKTDRAADGKDQAEAKEAAKPEGEKGTNARHERSSIAVGLGGIALQQDVEEEFSVFECDDPNAVVLTPQPSGHSFLASGFRASASPRATAPRANLSPQGEKAREEVGSVARPAFPAPGAHDLRGKSLARTVPSSDSFRGSFSHASTGCGASEHHQRLDTSAGAWPGVSAPADIPTPAAPPRTSPKSYPASEAHEVLAPHAAPFGASADRLQLPPQKAPLDEAAGRAAGRKLMALLGVKAPSLPSAPSLEAPMPSGSRAVAPAPQRVAPPAFPAAAALSFRSLLAAVEAQQTQRLHASAPREATPAELSGKEKPGQLAQWGRVAGVAAYAGPRPNAPTPAHAATAQATSAPLFTRAASGSLPGLASAYSPHVGHRPPPAGSHPGAFFSPSSSAGIAQRQSFSSALKPLMEGGASAGSRAFPPGQTPVFPHEALASSPHSASRGALALTAREEAAAALARWVDPAAARPAAFEAAIKREPPEPAASRGMERDGPRDEARERGRLSESERIRETRDEVGPFSPFCRQSEAMSSPQIAAALALLATTATKELSGGGRKREEREGSDSAVRARTPQADTTPQAALITALRAVIQNSMQKEPGA
ncbi:conserved hypothetical protein [Neospora caninum Liverpool]|uniref:Uncharacterized protein n=1 Tax=Neospora caninum (strain Liverpool) TaxID=572307 RepID=F0VQ60_NEOCL|nr:conserved hypothetical protein [Neospora caninum Liverpool]CBZ55857.1 conserved hypothetical protein [Neospora caninum Liverpool]CEL70601.1 TPA: hypothetical protein BN1204_062830 [Neospora caninum Liverpool]|eukprot:XP_003885883.1 conserved hypothetical protein [Neospora caninum Liverpool]